VVFQRRPRSTAENFVGPVGAFLAEVSVSTGRVRGVLIPAFLVTVGWITSAPGRRRRAGQAPPVPRCSRMHLGLLALIFGTVDIGGPFRTGDAR
jgi:hypothetical protein